MDQPPAFRRMVLGLPQNAKDYGSVNFTAELAELLRLDLVGIFAADENLKDIATLSCVRELRASGGWHPIDIEQLERGSSRAAAEARRLFAEAVKALHRGARFDLAKGLIGEAIGSQSTRDDIVVVIEPRNPAERVTYQFTQFLATAFNSPAAVLLVPNHIARRRGPIIAVAANERDPCIPAALKMAEASHERLLVLVPADANAKSLSQLTGQGSVPVDLRPIRSGKLTFPEVHSLLIRTDERLIVTGRGPDSRFAFRLASERAVPVLVTEQAPSP